MSLNNDSTTDNANLLNEINKLLTNHKGQTTVTLPKDTAQQLEKQVNLAFNSPTKNAFNDMKKEFEDFNTTLQTTQRLFKEQEKQSNIYYTKAIAVNKFFKNLAYLSIIGGVFILIALACFIGFTWIGHAMEFNLLVSITLGAFALLTFYILFLIVIKAYERYEEYRRKHK